MFVDDKCHLLENYQLDRNIPDEQKFKPKKCDFLTHHGQTPLDDNTLLVRSTYKIAKLLNVFL